MELHPGKLKNGVLAPGQSPYHLLDCWQYPSGCGTRLYFPSALVANKPKDVRQIKIIKGLMTFLNESPLFLVEWVPFPKNLFLFTSLRMRKVVFATSQNLVLPVCSVWTDLDQSGEPQCFLGKMSAYPQVHPTLKGSDPPAMQVYPRIPSKLCDLFLK